MCSFYTHVLKGYYETNVLGLILSYPSVFCDVPLQSFSLCSVIFFMFCLLVVQSLVLWLSVPGQEIDWKGSSPKWPTRYYGKVKMHNSQPHQDDHAYQFLLTWYHVQRKTDRQTDRQTIPLYLLHLWSVVCSEIMFSQIAPFCHLQILTL